MPNFHLKFTDLPPSLSRLPSQGASTTRWPTFLPAQPSPISATARRVTAAAGRARIPAITTHTTDPQHSSASLLPSLPGAGVHRARDTTAATTTKKWRPLPGGLATPTPAQSGNRRCTRADTLRLEPPPTLISHHQLRAPGPAPAVTRLLPRTAETTALTGARHPAPMARDTAMPPLTRVTRPLLPLVPGTTGRGQNASAAARPRPWKSHLLVPIEALASPRLRPRRRLCAP